MCRLHEGDLPVMKLKLSVVDQLRTLCRLEIVAESSAATSHAMTSPDRNRPNGKTFPPNERARSLSFVVPTFGRGVSAELFKLNSIPLQRRTPPFPFPS